VIRSALISDAYDIAEVHVSTWRAAYRDIMSETFLQSLSIEQREQHWRRAIESGDPEIWVSEQDATVVGWVAFGSSEDEGVDDTVAELQAIYILPNYWSAGLGQALWEKAKFRLTERGFKSVMLWVLHENLRAIRFYRAAGFDVDIESAKPVDIGGRALQVLRYHRLLA